MTICFGINASKLSYLEDLVGKDEKNKSKGLWDTSGDFLMSEKFSVVFLEVFTYLLSILIINLSLYFFFICLSNDCFDKESWGVIKFSPCMQN